MARNDVLENVPRGALLGRRQSQHEATHYPGSIWQGPAPAAAPKGRSGWVLDTPKAGRAVGFADRWKIRCAKKGGVQVWGSSQ